MKMKFVKENENLEKYVDNIFSVVNAAKADPGCINATAGCLYDEDGKMFTYKCVAQAEDRLTSIQKAAYAASPSGNKSYLDAVSEFVLENNVTNNYTALATPGGTGALSTAISMCLDEDDTIIFPEIAWGNYKVIANEKNLKVLTYDPYDLDDIFNKIDSVDKKVFLIVNSPCQNPLGYSYTLDEWKKIVDKLNNTGKETILLCDIAYIDYANDNPKESFKLFNDISDNLLVMIGASCSKAFSYYGQRLGLLITINNDKEFLDHFTNLASRLARATWSNVNNAAMLVIADVLDNHFDEYKKELDDAKAMLKKRVSLFVEQARENELELYKFSDGFFVTIKVADNKLRDEIHQRLIDNHIYTIKVNKGIRLGLCSVPLKIVDGLANKIKELM